MYKIGLIINPMAGIGGAVGLKGSDGDDIVAEAKKRGAVPQAGHRTFHCLQTLKSVKEQLHFICCPDAMGEEVLSKLGYSFSVLPMTPCCSKFTSKFTSKAGSKVGSHSEGVSEKEWSAVDTEAAVKLMVEQEVDLILFAGGDGTARNIFNALDELGDTHEQLVLGIPAGVKIHSGVYGVTPEAAGEIVRELVTGEIVSLIEAEVRDIDENAFRQGQVKTQFYGELSVPAVASCMQQVKNSGQKVESIELLDIATYVIEMMQKDILYIIGPGSTTKSITDELTLEGTLLGVDVVLNEELIAKDVVESELFNLIKGRVVRLIVTAIGGQGHIFGRGNQQLSPRVLKSIEGKNIWVVATKSKLHGLEKRPLIVDSGDPMLDKEFSGFIPVITGYEEKVIYQVGLENQ